MKNIEERMKIAEQILFGGNFALMTEPIKRGSVHNRKIGNSCTGFSMRIDNLSYRGIWLSTIENIILSVDGEEIPASSMLVDIKGLSIPVQDLGNHTSVFWGAEDVFHLSVYKVGGLTSGKHLIEIKIIKRPDFGHSFGNGNEGYEKAHEFMNPETICDSLEVEV